MSFTLTLNNFMAVRHAEIKIDKPITLLVGKSGSGKTSALRALGSLTSGIKTPLPSLKQNQSAVLLNREAGDKQTTAHLTWAEGGSEMRWTRDKAFDKVSKKWASEFGADMREAVSITAKELSEKLELLPTEDDLFNEIGLTDELKEVAKDIWASIKKVGWDATSKKCDENRADKRRRWEIVSGAGWGDRTSATWMPENYPHERTRETLTANIEAAQKIYEHSIKTNAVNEADRAHLVELSKQEPEARKEVQKYQDQLQEADNDLANQSASLQQAPAILNPTQTYKCWHCASVGILQGAELVQAPEQISVEDQEKAKAYLAECKRALAESEQARRDIAVSLETAKKHLVACQNAAKEVNKVVLDQEPTLNVDDARTQLETAKQQLQAFDAKKECDELYEQWGLCNHICSVLDPEGLRKFVLQKKLGTFNHSLAQICAMAEAPLVSLSDAFEFTFDGFPYVSLSTGHRKFVNACVQIALSEYDESQIICIDGIESMDNDLKEGLLAGVLAQIPLNTVITCNYSDRDAAFKLCAIGDVYWFEHNGVMQLEIDEVPA